MTNWITATGAEEAPTSNTADRSMVSTFQSEVGKGGGWESAGNGKAVSNPSTSYQNQANDDESRGVMATARSAAGSPIMSRNPNGDDIVMYQGTGIPLNVAANMGLVVRNADGSFSDKETPVGLKDPTAAAKAQAPAEKPTEDPKGEPEGITFGEAAEESLQELMAGQNPGDLIKTMDSVLQHGDIDQNTINRMASMAGVEPEQMAEQVATVWHGAYDAATDYMSDFGIENEDAFQAFITSDTRRQVAMMEAARNFFMHNKTEGLATMAEAYLPSMDCYEGDRVKEMLTEAGYEFADKPDGGINIIVNGQPISWDVAVKQKIVTFSRG